MKKILFITTSEILRPTTGTDVRSFNLLKNLADHYIVDVANISNFSRFKADDKLKINKGINKFYFIESKNKTSKIFNFNLMKKVLNACKLEKYYFVICDFGTTGIYGLLLKYLIHSKLVYSTHNVEFIRNWEMGRIKWSRYLFGAYMYMIERITSYFTDIIITVSEDDKTVFRRWSNKDNVFVLPNSVDTNIYNISSNYPKSNMVLFFGSSKYPPNMDAIKTILDEIVDTVIEKNSSVSFEIIGVSNTEIKVNNPNVIIEDVVDDISDAIKRSGMVIVPLKYGGGSRLKIIESLACGKIVISTEKGAEGLNEIFDNLIICKIEEFPEKILYFIEHNINNYNGQKDYQVILDKFSWSKNVLNLVMYMENKLGQQNEIK